MIPDSIKQKYEKLLKQLSATKGAVVAFSGGVDSAFLLHAAKEALGERLLAVTISTPYTPNWEGEEARELAYNLQVKQLVIELPFPEELRTNPADHCYTCKKILFTQILEVARVNGFTHVLDGTNIDDLSDYRPGIKALKELAITSPLVEAGLSKDEIRQLSKSFNLPTWDKPSFACLMSRMPIGVQVHDEDLRQIEQAEVFLMDIGFKAVRVRHHGDVARIEVPQDQVEKLIKANATHSIESKLKSIGYKHVAVDISGYQMGSLN